MSEGINCNRKRRNGLEESLSLEAHESAHRGACACALRCSKLSTTVAFQARGVERCQFNPQEEARTRERLRVAPGSPTR